MKSAVLVPDAISQLDPDVDTAFGRSPLSGLIAAAFGRAEAPVRATVLFVGMERGAGVSWMASMVSAELACSGRSVLLADAVAVVASQNAEEALNRCRQAGNGRAWMLASHKGQRTEKTLSAGGHRTGAILASLMQEFQHVVLDAPALSVSDVALKLAPVVSGSIFVVCADRTERRGLIKACGLFAAMGGRVLGCAFNAGLRQD